MTSNRRAWESKKSAKKKIPLMVCHIGRFQEVRRRTRIPWMSSLAGHAGSRRSVTTVTRWPLRTSSAASRSPACSYPPTRGRNWGLTISTRRGWTIDFIYLGVFRSGVCTITPLAIGQIGKASACSEWIRFSARTQDPKRIALLFRAPLPVRSRKKDLACTEFREPRSRCTTTFSCRRGGSRSRARS